MQQNSLQVKSGLGSHQLALLRSPSPGDVHALSVVHLATNDRVES
jgi:hypothetical protein